MACKAAVQQDITEFSALLKNKFKKKKRKVNRWTNNLRWEKVNMAFAKETVLIKSTEVFE